MKVVISKSDKSGKKLKAVFTRENGRTKTTHFGASGYDDYTLTKDKEQRTRYRNRHRKDNINNPESAGSLSWHVLWGESTSRQQNIKSYKRKFNLT
jgi:hypothetical protein|tara:strand:+ start:578 stop:865 length:288 start_codon:yes stop_codon:yes gene_type:complete